LETPADDDEEVPQRPNTAVFLARVWREDGAFRARITYHVDINSRIDTETLVVTADPAEVREQLAIWLEESAAAARGG
jgi:hypothetical protein